ncbi:MAG: hypothetical protein ACRDYB_11060 [Acidimicrobiales bacterium]
MDLASGRFRIGIVIGAAVLVTGALSTMTTAAAAGASLTVNPGAPVLNGQRVEAAGAGLVPGVNGIVVECNDAPGQPTVETHGLTLPVSCVDPFSLQFPYSQWAITTSDAGTFDTTLVVRTGVLGPPSDTATADSSGANPATDAAQYPCPPTAAQQADGVVCALSLSDGGGDHAQAPLAFGPPLSGHPAVALQGHGAATGDTVTVVASGLTPDSPTLVEECNLTPGEPPDPFSPGPAIGCTPPVGGPDPFTLPVSSDTGQLTARIALSEGNLGALAASAPYPCPPTAAQVASGSTCDVVVEDGAFRIGAAPVTLTGPVPVPELMVDSGHSGLLDGQQVTVTGSGFAADNTVTLYECNETPGEPTVEVQGVALPVGCDNPLASGLFQSGFASTGADGSLAPVPFTVSTGVLGPPDGGPESAAAYPCPPSPAEELAGARCDVVFTDSSNEVVSVPIAFDSPERFDPSMVVTSLGGGAPTLAFVPLWSLASGSTDFASLSGFTPDSPGFLFVCPFSPSPLQPNASLEGPCTLAGPEFLVPANGQDTVSASLPALPSWPVEALVAVDAAGDRAIATEAFNLGPP